jgi:hypothetical protein
VDSVLEQRADLLGGLSSLADHENLWGKVQERRARLEKMRLSKPVIELYDGDYQLRGAVAGERSGDFEEIENETGTASIQLGLDHYLAKWIMNHKGRQKRNIHLVIEKQGVRWSGRMSDYRVVKEDSGDCYLDVTFLHDFEELKHIRVWANPFLRPEFQFPKLWVIFGPARFCLLTTLFVNLCIRLEGSLWSLPDDPLDINEWMGPSFWPGNWRNIVKPYPLLGDNTPVTIVFSRFGSFYDTAKQVLDDTGLTITCRRYLPDRDPHPFENLIGEQQLLEDLYTSIPLRPGCLVWDVEDNNEWGKETAFGGSILVGLTRGIINLTSDGDTEGVDVFTGDATFPGEYYTPNYFGTSPQAPHVVFVEGKYTGIKSSEFQYFEATDTSFLTGGSSAPGINEAISAAVNIGGDIISSLINSALEAASGAPVGAIPVEMPSLGGMIDAVAQIFYLDVIAAFMQVPTLRATSVSLPIAGLENIKTGLGDHHYFEGWGESQKAFTLGAALAIKRRMFDTQAHTAHTLQISDAAPYLFGRNGYGHMWIGSRVGTTVLGYPDPDTIFVERVKKAKYSWGKDGPSGWQIGLGYRKPADPMTRVMSEIQKLGSIGSQLGLL